MTKLLKSSFLPVLTVIVLVSGVYWQFFVQGKIPVSADTMVGAYYPWLSYKWGYPAGVPVKNPPISDVFSQFILWKYLGVDMIKQGVWPLWNPYSYSGYPLLATYASSSLNPFNAILLLPKYVGWGLFIYGQTLVAALGMYIFTSLHTKNPLARIGSSIIFSFSSLMTTWVEFGTGVWAAAMLPWIFFSLESFLKGKKYRYLFLLAASFIVLFLSGHAQLTVYSSGLLFLYLLYKFVRKELNLSKEALFPLLFWLFAVGVSFVQLLPSFALSNASIRGSEVYSKQFNFGLSPLYDLVKLFASDIFGNPTTYNYWDVVSYHEQISFIGTLTIPLLSPFLLKRFRNSETTFWGIVFLGSLFFSIDNPVTHFFYSLPLPLFTYSSAGRILFVTVFSAAVIASFGIEKLLTDNAYKRFLNRSLIGLIAAIVGIAVGFFIGIGILKPYEKFDFVAQAISNYHVSLKNIIFPEAILVLFTVFLFASQLSFLKKVFSKKVVAGVLVLLLFIDLGRYFLKYNPFVPARIVFPETPVIEFLQNQDGLFRIGRVDHQVMTPNTWTAYNLQSVEGYDPLALYDYARLFNRINGKPYDTAISRYSEIENYPSPFLDALNVKYLLGVSHDKDGKVPGPLLDYKLQETNYKKVFEDKGTVVFQNPNAKDRAFFADKLASFSSKKDLIKELNNPKFDPTKEALIISSDPPKVQASGNEIKFLKYSPNNLVFITQTDGPSFVVLAEGYAQGWKALENGSPSKIYEVDGGIRGMQVPKGITKVEMIYEPSSFVVGRDVSAVALIALLSLSILFVRKRIW